MPVVEASDGPRQRVVEAELVAPRRAAASSRSSSSRYLLRLIVGRQLAAMYAALAARPAVVLRPAGAAVRRVLLRLGRRARLHAGTPNFALHLFAGMVVVHFFSETLNAGTRSVCATRALVQKMRMPREMFPVASMMVSLYHTGPQMLILLDRLRRRRLAPHLHGDPGRGARASRS